MPAHVPLASWRNESDARNDRPSEAVLSLDGSTEASWQFRLFNSVQAVPDSWPARGMTWSLLRCQGTGNCKATIIRSIPMLNIRSRRPPVVPDDNQLGVMRERYTTAELVAEQQVRVVFAGVDSAFHLWCNGQWVGYSQDSRLPAEFDLTDYLRAGENVLSVMVMRFCDGSYLEGQDMWNLSGIYRSVSLLAKPLARISDFRVTAALDSHYLQAIRSAGRRRGARAAGSRRLCTKGMMLQASRYFAMCTRSVPNK